MSVLQVIGPVHHGQPRLPPALNLENFHQGSKKFAVQSDDEFRETQIAMFQDPHPHRHHPAAPVPAPGVNRNVPEYFVWIDRDGSVHHVTYVESRQFYCNFLERAIRHQPDFLRLADMRASGINLLLCGFDAFEPAPNRTLEEVYLDPSTPFGHELVIYTMLVEPEEARWPWRIHKTFDF